MPWRSPAVFLGEFDAQDGPKINYAFEYFDWTLEGGRTGSPSSLYLVSGAGFVGRSVAGGYVHTQLHDFLSGVAARVLISNEAHEEIAVFQEVGCPAVGSLSFSLPDILARGEKRRFCLVVAHPVYEALLSLWPVIVTVLRIAVVEWTAAATARYHEEYGCFTDIERRRDQARCKPLRRLTTLLSSRAQQDSRDAARHDGVNDGDASDEVRRATFRSMLCFFDAALRVVFAPRQNTVSGDYHMTADRGTPQASDSFTSLQERIRTEAVITEALVKAVNFDDLLAVGRLPPFRGNDLLVRPLVAWLTDLARESTGSSKMLNAMSVMLHALFSGNQILIVAHNQKDVDEAARLCLGLAATLPPHLAKTVLYSSAYVMPYVGTIVCFSEEFYDCNRVVPFRQAECSEAKSAKEQLVLAELDFGGAVCVTVDGDRIVQVAECDKLARAATLSHSLAGSPSVPANGSRGLETAPVSTLSERIVSLVQDHDATHTPQIASMSLHDVTALRLLDAQVHQLVCEYVLRANVYVSLYRAQELQSRQSLLSPTGTSYREAGGRPRGAPPERTAPSTEEQRTTLDIGVNRAFARDNFVFTSSALEDHDVLVFLGSSTAS